MYQSIFELPTQVLGSLNEEDCIKWLRAYNSCQPRNDVDAKKAKRFAWHSVESAPSSFSFKAIASTDTIDKARDIIDLDTVKEHMDALIDRGGNIQNDHHNYTVGTIWDWAPCTIKVNGRDVDAITVWGNLFGGNTKGDVYNNTRKAFVDGMNSLSIAGNAAKGKYECDERGCYTRRMVDQLMEVSITTNPMNTYCTLEWYNEGAPIAKSASALNLGLVEYEIHKDETTCPYLSLKRSLLDAGFENVHAREDGVHVRSTPITFTFAKSHIEKNGLVGRYEGSEMILNDRSHYIEKSFKECHKAGYIDDDGYFTKSIPEEKFREYAAFDIITEDDKGFRFACSDQKMLDDYGVWAGSFYEEPKEMTEDEEIEQALASQPPSPEYNGRIQTKVDEDEWERPRPPPAAMPLPEQKKAEEDQLTDRVTRLEKKIQDYLDGPKGQKWYIKNNVKWGNYGILKTPEEKLKHLLNMDAQIKELKWQAWNNYYLNHGGSPPPGRDEIFY